MGVVRRKGPRRPRGLGGKAQGRSYENSTNIVAVCGQVRAGAPALLYIGLRRPFSKGSLLFSATSSSSAAVDSFSRKVCFKALLFIATSFSSAAVDLFSGKVFLSRLTSPHCNKLVISCSGFVQRKGFLKALFASLQQALHQLQWSRSAERLSCKALFSSMQQALVSCSGSFSGKGFLSRLYPIQRNKLSSAAVDCSVERFSFQGSLALFNAKSSSSAAFDSFSGKVPFFKALSLQNKTLFCKKRLSLFKTKCSSSAAFDSFSGKVPFSKALSLQCKLLFISCL